MVYCNVSIVDAYYAVSKSFALKETIKYMRKEINTFDSSYSAAIEFVKIYNEHADGVKFFTENEIKEIATLGVNVCLLCKTTRNTDLDEKSKIYSDIYSFIYNEIKTKYKNIITENKITTQYVRVKKVRRRYR